MDRTKVKARQHSFTHSYSLTHIHLLTYTFSQYTHTHSVIHSLSQYTPFQHPPPPLFCHCTDPHPHESRSVPHSYPPTLIHPLTLPPNLTPPLSHPLLTPPPSHLLSPCTDPHPHQSRSVPHSLPPCGRGGESSTSSTNTHGCEGVHERGGS